jgi:hypothetical protein
MEHCHRAGCSRKDRWSQTAVAVAANRLRDVMHEAGDARERASRFRQALRIASELAER